MGKGECIGAMEKGIRSGGNRTKGGEQWEGFSYQNSAPESFQNCGIFFQVLGLFQVWD
jgi:hypothetical protein